MDFDFMTSFLGAPRWGPTQKAKKPIPDPQDVFCNPQKLDVALRTDIVENFVRYNAARRLAIAEKDEFTYDSRYELLRSTKGLQSLSMMKTSTEFLPIIMMKIMNASERPVHRQDLDKSIKRALDLVYQNAKVQMEYNLSVMSEGCQEQVSSEKADYLGRLRTVGKEIPSLIEAYYLLSEVVDKIPSGQIPAGMNQPEAVANRIEAILDWETNKASIDLYGVKFFWSGDICVIEVDSVQYLLPIMAIVELQNKVADHLSVLLYAWTARGTYIEDSAYHDTIALLKELHSRHSIYPLSFFSVAGALEALGTAVLISRHDDWSNGPNSEFLESTLADLNLSCRAVGDPGLTPESPIVRCLTRASSPLVAELCCLSKMSGHPLTSIEKGMEKLHERTTRPRRVQVAAVAYTTQSVKKEFLKEYFTDNGEYPPKITIGQACNIRLKSALTLGKDIDDPALDCYGTYSMEDFALITIGEFESLDYLDNILPYLKDTASSITQSRVWKDYIENNSQPDRKDMRFQKILLMYVMGSEEEIDHVTFAHEFEKYGAEIEDFMEQFAIRLVAKEKELKLLARLFGCMTYKYRAVNQIVLRFMQKFLRRYCSSQAMIVTELELARKLSVFSKKKNLGAGMRSFTICMDAEGWNNAFTKETVAAPLRETIDRMLGNSMVSRLHEAFEYTTFYAQEKGRVIYYHGQNGGIEGLQQGSWMLVYVHQIRYALRDCPYEYDILIKGDDVRVRFEISKSRALPGSEETLLSNIRDNLTSGLEEFGHRIKILDSYYSENVLVFSKKIFIEDVSLPSSFRQIQKTYGANNKFMATTDDLVGSAYSNAHSAAGYGVNVLAPYLVALFWSAIHILRIPFYRRMPDSDLLALMMTPSALGGFPVIYLHNMFVRAESDLVSAFCGLALFCRENHAALYQRFRRVLDYKVAKRLPWALLVADPYAVPREGYTNPTGTLERVLKEKLRIRAVNPVIKHLFSKEVDKFKEDFINAVTSADIYDAKLVNAIAECTDFAVQERFLQKFVSAKTMIQHIWSMTEKQREIRMLCARLTRESKQRDKERAGLLSPQAGKRVGVNADEYDCPTKLAEDLREFGWEKPIEGITYPPTQHQVRVITADEVVLRDVQRCFVYEIQEGSEMSPFLPTPHFHRSAFDPYLGHYTPSGTIGAPLEIDTQDIVVGMVRKLLTLSTMSLLEDTADQPPRSFTMYDLILYLLSRFTKLSIEDLHSMINCRKSGTRTHHLPARGFRVGIIPNMTKNLMSHIRSQVNTFRELRVTGENFRINFLHLFCHTSVLLHFNWFLPNPTMNVGSFRSTIPDCDECFVPIKEKNMYMFDNDILNNDSELPENLISMAEHANDLIKSAMDSEERESDIRSVNDYGAPGAEVACSVVASEFFASTLVHHTRMALGFRLIRPTADRVKDVVMLKGKAKRNRDITGSELVKIPSKMLMETLREAILHHVYSVKSTWQTSEILAAFMVEDGRSLPWSTCVQQIIRHSKIQSLIAECCIFAGLPISAGSNACREYGKASTFIGRVLSTHSLSVLPASNRSICVGKYAKSSNIHLQITNKRLMRLLFYVTRFPLRDLLDDIEEFGIWGDHSEEVITILLLATGPTWSVEEIREGFAYTHHTVDFEMVAEIGPTWYGGVSAAKLRSRIGLDHMAIMEMWLDGSGYTWGDVEGYLTAQNDGMKATLSSFLEGGLTSDTLVRISFLDLSECYQMVRQLDVPQELDDYGATGVDPRDTTNLISCKIFPREAEVLERMWTVPTASLDFGQPLGHDVVEAVPPNRIDFTHLQRPLGWTTSAWIKTARILQALGMTKRWEKLTFNIGCFADGDGGDSRWLAETFLKSVVIWNSLNPSLADRIQAPLASRRRDVEEDIVSTHPRIRFDNQMMEMGDLTRDFIVNLLCDEVPHYGLVKHDADLPLGEDREKVARQLWLNVLRIWTRKGTNHSVLIEKVFADIPSTLGWFLAVARPHCRHCYLVTLKESHCSYEAYVVCVGPVGVLPSTVPMCYAPSEYSRIAYECYVHCRDIIRGSSNGVSSREATMAIPVSLPPGNRPPIKCLSAFATCGVGVDDMHRPDIAVAKVIEVRDNLVRQLTVGGVEINVHRVVSGSITHALVIMENLVFLWSILAVVEAFGLEPVGLRRRINRTTKKTIWEKVEAQLADTSNSPRFRGVGGPFQITDEVTGYQPGGAEEEVQGRTLRFRENFHAGIKTGMEFLSYVYVCGGLSALRSQGPPDMESDNEEEGSWADW